MASALRNAPPAQSGKVPFPAEVLITSARNGHWLACLGRCNRREFAERLSAVGVSDAASDTLINPSNQVWKFQPAGDPKIARHAPEGLRPASRQQLLIDALVGPEKISGNCQLVVRKVGSKANRSQKLSLDLEVRPYDHTHFGLRRV